MLIRVSIVLSRVSLGMAAGHGICPRHPEPAVLILMWGLAQQWCQASKAGEAFCLSLSGICLAGHIPAILSDTFSARQSKRPTVGS